MFRYFPLCWTRSKYGLCTRLGVLNERGYVLVDANCQTKIPGIYAAGDVIDKELRQVVTACNDGAIAAQHAFHTIKGI